MLDDTIKTARASAERLGIDSADGTLSDKAAVIEPAFLLRCTAVPSNETLLTLYGRRPTWTVLEPLGGSTSLVAWSLAIEWAQQCASPVPYE